MFIIVTASTLIEITHWLCFSKSRTTGTQFFHDGPESAGSTSVAASCWETAVTVDDVDTGDASLGSGEGVVAVARARGGVETGWTSTFDGLAPVTGLQTPAMSSGQRKTSMAPRVLFKETW